MPPVGRQRRPSNESFADKLFSRRRQSLLEMDRKSHRHHDDNNPLLFSSSSCSSDSSSSGFSSSNSDFLRPKPVKTTALAKLEKASYYQQSEYFLFDEYNHDHQKNHEELSILNSLFTAKNTKKTTKTLSSAVGGYEESCIERKSKSTQASSACSSVSSYSKSVDFREEIRGYKLNMS